MKKHQKRVNIAFFCVFLSIFLTACSPKTESGDYFLSGDAVYKKIPELKPEQVELAAKKINFHIEAHPEAGNIYLSVIPDKSFYVEENGSASFEKIAELICGAAPDAEYIDLFELLSAEDYYRTDSHWRQESILPVAQTLCEAMGTALPLESEFAPMLVGSFQGVYARLSKLKAEDDELYIMESEATRNASVSSAETEGTLPVYSPERLEGDEPYDVFLSGAQAVLTIENPLADTGRELVIFRDSFGSSLAPLLIGSYAKITLIDLRYIMSDFISEYADFDGADVLFLYSTALLNSGGILK